MSFPGSVQAQAGALTRETLAGRYRLIARIGRGGMGEVYRARDLELKRTVAVKILPPDLAGREEIAGRFRHEAQAAARLNHPNIVQVHDASTSESVHFMVMEYVRGRSLRHVLAARGALEARQAAEVALQLLDALGASHKRGLVHRDVKPENVLITIDGVVKVTDFGIARAVEAETGSGELVGTVAYASPEQIRGSGVDARSDLYAAGCVLYELITGSPPFEGDVASVLNRHLHGRVGAPSSERPEAGMALDRVVLKATEPEAAHRYASAADMKADVAAVFASLPEAPPLSELTEELTSEVPVESMETAVPSATPPRPRRVLRRVLATLMLAALLGGAWAWFRPTRMPETEGMSYEAASRALAERGLAPRRELVFADAPEGTVLGSEPATGAWARRGESIVLEVSRGPRLTEVPVVAGRSLEEARAALEAAGLPMGRVEEQFAREAPGTVLDQEPKRGLVRSATPVNLVVSRGPEIAGVPGVLGKSADEASALLQAAGFGVRREEAYSDQAAGTVVGQEPAPPAEAEKGSEVKLVVSRGPQPFGMPDVKNRPCSEAKKALEGRGLAVSVQARTGGCGAGRVLDQDPLPGTQVRKGQEATLYVG